jgi:DNA-binding protein HU-beta
VSKADLVAQVAEKAGLTKRDASAAVDALVEALSDALRSGARVHIYGFGVFEVVRRAAKVGRNPRTGQRVDVPARRAVRFRASRLLKEAVA